MSGAKQYFSTIGSFWQEKSNGQIFRWNLLSIAIQVIILFFKFNDLPSQVPLFYSQPWGTSQLAPAVFILILPVSSVFFLLINNSLAVSFLHSNPLLSRLLIVVSLLFSVFSTLALYHIITLVS